jgi:dethiobiotin synthetase
LARARRSFATRRVDFDSVRYLITNAGKPEPSQVILARVDAIGQHARLELPDGRRSKFYEGDEIIVAYGARYAPDQFEAHVPDDFGPCELVAGGGIAARVASRHATMRKATNITPIGLLADADGHPINLARTALPPAPRALVSPSVVVVAGTSMNAGKTTTAASLIRGLARAGLRVGATKVTGTGSGGDLWSMWDAGASVIYDFTDMGHATTCGVLPSELEAITRGLVDHLAAAGVDVVVMEIADGLLQAQTAALLASRTISQIADAVVFAAGEALGAAHGVDWLRSRGLPVIAISGLVSASPLSAREAATVTGLPILTIQQLTDGAFAPKLILRDGGLAAAQAALA